MKSTPVAADQTPRHPIAVVSERTGLSQDVLRVWERRYRAVEPRRGPGGHRAYSDADIARLRLLHAATSAGRSIGQVASLSTEELERLANEDRSARAERIDARGAAGPDASRATAEVLAHAINATARLESAELQHMLRRAVVRLGVNAFIEDVVSPFLRQVGDDWHAGRLTIAQEHLASTTIHDIVVESMRAIVPPNDAPTLLVSTPAGERHAIGAALVAATAATDGWRVLYLGADLPASEVATAARSGDARVVAMSATYLSDRRRTLDELRALRALLPPHVTLVVGGAGAATIAADLQEAGIRVGATLAHLRETLRDATPGVVAPTIER
jgi:MerR family transcriptional regulator, light-induced transcriptional regulator